VNSFIFCQAEFNEAWQWLFNCHCEERSDEAILYNTIWEFFYKYKDRLLRPD